MAEQKQAGRSRECHQTLQQNPPWMVEPLLAYRQQARAPLRLVRNLEDALEMVLTAPSQQRETLGGPEILRPAWKCQLEISSPRRQENYLPI